MRWVGGSHAKEDGVEQPKQRETSVRVFAMCGQKVGLEKSIWSRRWWRRPRQRHCKNCFHIDTLCSSFFLGLVLWDLAFWRGRPGELPAIGNWLGREWRAEDQEVVSDYLSDRPMKKEHYNDDDLWTGKQRQTEIHITIGEYEEVEEDRWRGIALAWLTPTYSAPICIRI